MAVQKTTMAGGFPASAGTYQEVRVGIPKGIAVEVQASA